MRATRQVQWRKFSATVDGAIHGYPACISCADAMMGRVLDSLETSRLCVSSSNTCFDNQKDLRNNRLPAVFLLRLSLSRATCTSVGEFHVHLPAGQIVDAA